MASNREERFLQRQRGAGIHKIKDVDFGLAFPGANNVPLRPQRSSRRRTPQPEQQPLLPQRSSRRTPKLAEPRLPQQSAKRTPTSARNHLPERPSPYDIPRTEDKEVLPSSQVTRSDSQGSVSKKRRITGLSAAQRLSTIAQNALLETPSVGDSELQSSREPLTGPESIARGGIEAAEVSEVPGQDAQSETREKSISSPTLATMGTELGALDEESGEVNRDVVPFEDPADTQEQGQGSASGNHGRPLKPRRRKRISIVKPPKRRKRPSKNKESVEFDDQEPEEENLEPPTRVPSVPPGSQNRSKSTLATIEEELVDGYKPQEESAEEEWEDDKEAGKPAKQSENPHNRPPKQRRETAHSARRKPPTSPNKQAKRRRRGTVDSDAGSAEENGETQVRQRLRTRIPITVQRLYRPQALGSDNDEQGMLNDSTVFPRRKGVNGVDVLSQVCSELIAKAVDRLQQATDSGTNRVAKAELKRRKRVAMGFGEELENKLFDLSEAVDNNWALSTRLKQANKEKATLRDELLRIRREREKVALRTDEVRRLHEEATVASQDQNDLSKALYDIELAVKRGRTQQQAGKDSNSDDNDDRTAGLELRLETLAESVSSSHASGGLLRQVKDFNAFLERTATVLESKP